MELPSTGHLKQETTDMRSRGLTINPLTGGGGGGATGGASEGGTADSGSSGEEPRLSGGYSGPGQDALERLLFYRSLFAEGVPPRFFRRWWTPRTVTAATAAAQVYCVVIRIAMLNLMGFLTFSLCAGGDEEFTPAERVIVFIPILLATLACLASTCILQGKFHAAAEDATREVDTPLKSQRRLNLEDINWAGRLATVRPCPSIKRYGRNSPHLTSDF